MNKLMLAVALALSLVGTAQAKTYKFGEPPELQATLPDRWEASDIDNGVQATSPDKVIYLALESFPFQDSQKHVEETTNFFFEQGLIGVVNSMKKM